MHLLWFGVRLATVLIAPRRAANMKKAILKKRGGSRPGAGRPATGNDPVRTFRLSDEFIAKLDAWALTQEDKPARAEAVRRLVELGLKAKGK
jgi:hypothetical protein